MLNVVTNTVADPGFLVGGVDSCGGYVSKILYVETKESGPGARPLDPLMKQHHSSS